MLTVSIIARHCIEPVLHWEESSRASSALGAAAVTATRAATGRMVEKRGTYFQRESSVGSFERRWDAFY